MAMPRLGQLCDDAGDCAKQGTYQGLRGSSRQHLACDGADEPVRREPLKPAVTSSHIRICIVFTSGDHHLSNLLSIQ
jgi:hypothetical protein